MRWKKLGVILILMSFLIVGILLQPSRRIVRASTLTYQTDFSTGTWVNRTGGVDTGPTSSPFTINTNGHQFLLSYGSRSSENIVYFGNLGTTTASSYFRLDSNLLHEAAEAILAPFDPLGTDAFEMVLAMKSSLYFVSLTSMTLSWTGFGNTAFTGKVIYSLDQGISWQVFGDSFAFSKTTAPQSITRTFNVNDTYTSINLGYYVSVNSVTSSHYIQEPSISFSYNQMSDEDSAHAFKNEVILYTPCITDEDQLTLITPAKKTELIDKYGKLSSQAKSLLANLSIGGGFTALDRYLFLTK